MKHAIVAALLLVGCSPVDFFIGPTAVRYEYLAEPYPDLNDVLWNSSSCLDRFRYDAAEVLSVSLRIHPVGTRIVTPRDPYRYGRTSDGALIGGAYWAGEIQVVQRGEPLLLIDSAWTHELLQHRLTDVVDGHPNEHHDEVFADRAFPLERCILEMTR